MTLVAGAAVSAIGSLTFLVGEKFPEEFANFTHLNISNSTSNGLGKYLAWSNVVVEALFYTWTISGILPLLQPEQNDVPLEHERTSYFRQCCSKLTNWRSWLPNFGEWGLAAASTIPLTLVSLIDQEAVTGSFKYAIVGSIGFITLISNKFFLDLTHRQFKSVGTWLWSCYKTEPSSLDVNFLEQVKKAFSESTICANEKLKHLQKKEFKSLVSSLKGVAQIHPTEGETTYDRRWINLTNYMFKDLSFRPNKINKQAIIFVPSLGVFTSLSWLGLIASVPDGIEKKWSSSPALQYTFAVFAGIPLIEIGLSMGGSFGLKLSRIGEGIYSVSENITNRIERFSGYSLITLAGLGSFATAATLTIQQFEAIPALTWFLLPCTILGMDLINIASGIELWDEFLIAIKTQSNQDKALFVNHIKFLNSFQKKVEITPANEVAVLLLNLDPSIQKNIIQFLPAMKGKDLNEWNNAIIEALKLEKDQKKILEINVESSKNGETVD